MKKTSMRPLAVALTLAMAATASIALANETESELDTITVTANRSATQLKYVSDSVAWLSQQEIETLNHQHVQQALHRIPGTWVSRGNGQEHLTAIRSPVLTGAGGCGAFLMAEDGISLRAPGFCNTNQLFDANTEQAGRLEVVRGPGSALYGSNAVHGMINILSRDAFSAAPASVTLEAGPHDYYRGLFSAGMQRDNSAFLVYGNLAHDGGYKNDSGFDQQKINAVYQWRGQHWENKTVFSATNLNQETAGFIQGEDAYKDQDLKATNPNPEAFRDAKSVRLHSSFSRDLGSNDSLTITPYLRWNEMAFLQHFLPWKALEENSHQSVGVQGRYSLTTDAIDWTLGLDVDITDGELQETQDQPFSPTIPQGDHYDYQVDATILAPYAQAEWKATDALRITLGVRFEDTEYDYTNRLSDGSACAPEVETCRFTRPTDQVVSYQEWSPKLGITYQLSDSVSVFAKAAQGYRAPQATELFRLQNNQQTADLSPEKIDAFEIGLRGVAAFDSARLAYDAVVFTMDKKNFIFQDTNRQNISNGETTHDGIELNLSVNWDNGVFAKANASFAEHEYANDIAISRSSIRGNEIDTAPRTLGAMQIGWEHDQGHRLALEWQHTGDYYLNPENTASYPGHDLVNLFAAYQLTSTLEGAVRIFNLTDTDYAERADFGFGNYRYFVGEPRSVYVSLSWRP